jgi:hypothetical protein
LKEEKEGRSSSESTTVYKESGEAWCAEETKKATVVIFQKDQEIKTR